MLKLLKLKKKENNSYEVKYVITFQYINIQIPKLKLQLYCTLPNSRIGAYAPDFYTNFYRYSENIDSSYCLIVFNWLDKHHQLVNSININITENIINLMESRDEYNNTIGSQFILNNIITKMKPDEYNNAQFILKQVNEYKDKNPEKCYSRMVW